MVTITLSDNNALILKHIISKRINEIDTTLKALNNINYDNSDIISLYNERTTLLFMLKKINNELNSIKEVKS